MSKKSNYKAGTGIALGVGLGVTLGIIFDNLALWVSIGIILGVTYDGVNKKKIEQEKDKDS